jgi:predicted transglutaminase-like cysteine proteinase
MKKLKLIWCAIFIIISTSAQAKWATYDDAAIKASTNEKTDVDSSGKTKETLEAQFEILKEPGRNIAANFPLVYNGASEKIKILEAKTIYKGKEYKLNKDLIEDKPLASTPGGFDQKRQILLAFPKAEVGAKIVLKYVKTTSEVPLDKFYADVFWFGDLMYMEKARVKLHSQIPLHIRVNDPEKVLRITKDADNNFHNLEIILTKPLYRVAINEPATNIVNNKYLTWVSVSSLTKWEDLALRFAPLYAKVFTQSLPPDFIKIADMAAQKTNEIDQINTVTSLLNDKIQYMGDWRTIKGAFVPRSLDKISKTQLGDCKDFAASTAAILAKLGFKAQVAIVRRGVRAFYPDSLPDIAAFNHAFVKVTNKQGKIYWIDPTNFQSMADGTFPDITNKIALIIDRKQPSYEKVASINSEHAQILSARQIEIVNDNKIIVNGNLTLKNEEAYPLIGAALQTSETNIKDILFNQLSGTTLEEKNKINLQLPDLKSRIVKDISFKYTFEQENGILKTNLGQAMNLIYSTLANFFAVAQDYIADILIYDTPFSASKQTIIKNIKAQNVESLNKEIKTPWLYVSRKCSLNSNRDLQIDDTIVVYKNLIPNEDIKSPEFIKLKDDLEKNFKDVAVVFNK